MIFGYWQAICNCINMIMIYLLKRVLMMGCFINFDRHGDEITGSGDEDR
jgi:hypothetical protein